MKISKLNFAVELYKSLHIKVLKNKTQLPPKKEK